MCRALRIRDTANFNPLATGMPLKVFIGGDETGDQVLIGYAGSELLGPIIKPLLIGGAAKVVQIIGGNPLALALDT